MLDREKIFLITVVLAHTTPSLLIAEASNKFEIVPPAAVSSSSASNSIQCTQALINNAVAQTGLVPPAAINRTKTNTRGWQGFFPQSSRPARVGLTPNNALRLLTQMSWLLAPNAQTSRVLALINPTRRGKSTLVEEMARHITNNQPNILMISLHAAIYSSTPDQIANAIGDKIVGGILARLPDDHSRARMQSSISPLILPATSKLRELNTLLERFNFKALVVLDEFGLHDVERYQYSREFTEIATRSPLPNLRYVMTATYWPSAHYIGEATREWFQTLPANAAALFDIEPDTLEEFHRIFSASQVDQFGAALTSDSAAIDYLYRVARGYIAQAVQIVRAIPDSPTHHLTIEVLRKAVKQILIDERPDLDLDTSGE